MRDFARRAAGDRAAFFAEAAARRSVPAWMLEKDFWVCVPCCLVTMRAVESAINSAG